MHIDHFKIAGLITLRKTVEYNIGVCIVFAVDCHFSFQEIVCRREEELEDGKVIKTFRTIFIFFIFFSLNLIAVSHRMQPRADPAFLKSFFGCF